jgi:flagellar biosynthesis/type III secretory pathway protein FliH
MAHGPKLDLETYKRVVDRLTRTNTAQFIEQVARQVAGKVLLKSHEQGVAQGREYGATHGQRAFLLRLLTMRFGSLSEIVIARIRKASSYDIEYWTALMLDDIAFGSEESSAAVELAPILDPETLEAMRTYRLKLEQEIIEKIIAEAARQATEAAQQDAFDRGVEQGFDRGFVAVQRGLLRDLLARRFGSVPAAIDARLEEAGADEIERWTQRIIDAASLDEVFAATGTGR